MRALHRKIGVFFAPFLALSALTGLLWAYAPHLYLKPIPAPPGAVAVLDENRTYVSPSDAIRAAKALSGAGRVSSVSLRVESGVVVYVINVNSDGTTKELWVNASSGEARPVPRDGAKTFHQWVMRIHRLGFLGTKKELTAIPGIGLLTLLVTGLFLWRKKC